MSATWEQAEWPLFTLHTTAAREWLTVDTFPEVILVTETLKDNDSLRFPEFLRFRDDDTIRIEVENGWCTYAIVDYDSYRGEYLCERLGCS